MQEPRNIIFEQIAGVDCQIIERAHHAAEAVMRAMKEAGYVIVKREDLAKGDGSTTIA
jgi:hypothetical protein